MFSTYRGMELSGFGPFTGQLSYGSVAKSWLSPFNYRLPHGPSAQRSSLHYSFNWCGVNLPRIYPMFFGYLVAVIFQSIGGGCSLPKYESRQSKRMESRLGNAGLGCIHEVHRPGGTQPKSALPGMVGVWALAVQVVPVCRCGRDCLRPFLVEGVSGNG